MSKKKISMGWVLIKKKIKNILKWYKKCIDSKIKIPKKIKSHSPTVFF